MHRCVVACCCRLVLVAALCAGAASCRSMAPTGNLTGTVQDAVTAAPIGGTAVTVGELAAYTDSQGHFSIHDLTLGDRPATVTAPGYHPLEQTVTIRAGDNSVVFELHRMSATDGGLGDGPVSDGQPADGSAHEDGGQRDGGQRDAGQRDTGQQDAGQRDAGQRDTGQRDTGQQDAPTVCTGNACSYGYTYGGCCANAPYCANYSGASSLVCRATCGAVNERCGYGSDCCNNNCVYNSSAGWNICN